MSSASLTPRLNLARVVFVGLIVPILLAVADHWLLSREFESKRAFQALCAFVVQVGLLGVLCATLVRPPWLRWIIYGWCLLLTDLNAASSIVPELSQSLFTAQLGLVTVWAVLGTARWTMRVPVVLVLLVPLMGNIAQTAALCLICLVLRSQRFRLILAAPATDSEAISTAEGPALRPIQFGMRDVLLWTTALAPLLAIVRIDEGRMLTAGVLHAIVLVVALWTALGKGPAWLRWPLLLLFALVAGFVLVKVDEFHIGWRPPFTPFWRVTNLHYFWLWQWKTVAEFLLAGGMLAATLLIYRVLGYRLCRDLPRRAAI